MLKRLQELHWLNLDVAAGAGLCAAAASRLPDGAGPVNRMAIVVLMLTVWVIYTADRLLDVRKKPVPSTPRHRFHLANAGWLWKLTAGVAALAGGLALTLPAGLLRSGGILAGIVAAYLLLVNRLGPKSKLHLFKEPLTALVYTAGVWGVAFSGKEAIAWEEKAQAGIFLLIAFQNLLLFSWMETRAGKPPVPNLSSILREGFSDVLFGLCLAGIAGLFLAISFTELVPYQRRFAFTQVLMSLVLVEIRRDYRFYLKNERYRWVGDGIFLLPFWLF